MCTLTYCEPGFTPKKKDLTQSCRNNPDGFGFAIVTDSGIIVGKDMNAAKLMKSFYKERYAHQDGPALFHSRIGTHGEKGIDNCHPFWVDEEKLTVVAHNGVMRVRSMAKKEDEKRSDTGIFAQDYLSRIGVANLDSPQIFDMVEDWIGRGNKIVVLTVDPKAENQSYILNESTGHWIRNEEKVPMIWWSNTNYKPVVQSKYTAHTYNYNYDHEGKGWFKGEWIVNDDYDNHPGEIWAAGQGWIKESAGTKFQVESFERDKAARLAKKAREAAKKEAEEVVAGIKPDLTEAPTRRVWQTNGGRSQCHVFRKSEDGVYRWFDVNGMLVNADDRGVVERIDGGDEDEEETCPTCGVEIDKFSDDIGYCQNCSTCLICEEFAEWCECKRNVVDEAEEILAELEAIHESLEEADSKEKQMERRRFLAVLLNRYVHCVDTPQLTAGEVE